MPADATRNPLNAITARQPFMIVDGALATELERAGFDLNDSLWSAKVLADDPQAIVDVHRAYFEAGADVATTASYQATLEGLMARSLSETQASALIQRSVTLAAQARSDYLAAHPERLDCPPLVAASVGPYGAWLADGSEYRGGYVLDRAGLRDFHRARLATLLDAKPDVLAVETLPCAEEALAVCDLLRDDFPTARAWVAFSARNATELSDGTPIRDAVRAIADCKQVVAIGVNCTALEHIESLVREIRGETDKDIVIYPNSGEVYDPVTKTWSAACAVSDADGHGSEHGSEHGYDHDHDLAGWTPRWLAAGATAIGGCCRTGPDDIRALSDLRKALS